MIALAARPVGRVQGGCRHRVSGGCPVTVGVALAAARLRARGGYRGIRVRGVPVGRLRIPHGLPARVGWPRGLVRTCRMDLRGWRGQGRDRTGRGQRMRLVRPDRRGSWCVKKRGPTPGLREMDPPCGRAGAVGSGTLAAAWGCRTACELAAC